MSTPLVVAGVAAASLASLFFSTLTYSLRHFSRTRLGDYLQRHDKTRWLAPTIEHSADLVFVTAMARLIANMLILIGVLELLYVSYPGESIHTLRYILAVIITGIITLFVSVAIPHAAAKYGGEIFVGACAGLLHTLRWLLTPVTKIMHAIEGLARKTAGATAIREPEQIEEEILSVVEEGQKEGVVDDQEREMIQSVIQFRDTQAGQIMTARTEIVALDIHCSVDEIKRTIEESGHSRIPVYDGTLDQIRGILYARDLLRYLGVSASQFDITSAMRPAFYVPEIKPLRDLLRDFRLQKVHLAIVLDEYGGTAGLVTIEDILEELVGDISDEHEPKEPALLKRIDDHTYEADARIYIDEFNRVLGAGLPEDDGYDTLGGFISASLGRIPAANTTFEHKGIRYTILDAEPQKVNRVKIVLLPQHASEAAAG
ncbi:MAG TPA: hemolysin family protein [Tepidisphaeraceae bacterium]|jgi:CBS domain containing-hemolysin-like protein